MAEETKEEPTNNGEQPTSQQEEPTGLDKKIIRQIEYYFGNSNMRRDRFLQLQVREDNGWVTLEVMMKFNRLSQLAKDPAVVVAALAKSKTGLMEISEDKKKIRRSPNRPLPEENAANMLQLKARTVYCKGFPLDEKIDKIQEFMDQFGETESIFMRRDSDRKFKGSIFASYKTKAEAEKFMEPETLKYGETETIRYFKSDYYKMKAEERKNQKEQNKKERKEKKEKADQEIIEANTEYKEFEKGLVIHFTGASDQTSREDLKEVFGDYSPIAWVDFNIGQTEGTIRFEEGSKAQEVIDRVLGDHNNKLEVRGSELTMRVLEGEEEEQHWKRAFENMAKVRHMKQQGKRKRKDKRPGDRRQGRGNRYQGKKTKFAGSDNEGEEEEESNIKEQQDGKKIKEQKDAIEVKSEAKEEQGEKRPLEEASTAEEPSAKQTKTD